MRLHELVPDEGAKKEPKRIGRGIGSGTGKTAAKGHKGQKSRSGGVKGAGFEGGQMPLQRRLPKRGFSNCPFKKEFTVVNVSSFNIFDAGTTVTPEDLLAKRIISQVAKNGIKVLGHGELAKGVTVKAHGFTKTAVEKIAAAGGKTEVI